MAPIPSSRRRPFNTRGRSVRKSRPRSDGVNGSDPAGDEAPPLKKRRYVPGGPGGGGRYVDIDGTETPVGGTGPGGYNYTGPRGRIGPENAANGVQPVSYSRPRRESRRDRAAPKPRYSSAAAAAAAAVQGDGFKPREERSWEEFHQDLDIGKKFPAFSAEEVDGIVKAPATPRLIDQVGNGNLADGANTENAVVRVNNVDQRENSANPGGLETPFKDDFAPDDDKIGEGSLSASLKRRPGRPPRRHDSMLKGIGTPDIPKTVPLPGPNPRERLTLPKPSFRPVDPFISYEQKAAGQLNYVDRSMASVGYQESDIYIRPEKKLIRVIEGTIEEELDNGMTTKSDGDGNTAMGGVGLGRVEYDMDEQDQKWLDAYNTFRRTEQVEPIKPAIFEITMTKIEKEWHALEKRIPKPNPKPPQMHRPRSSSAAAVNGEPHGPGEEQDSKCAICDDGDCENTNAIVFCDGCDLAVHQDCYGVPFIPEGQWLCRKCQLIGRGTPTCIFCPNTDGAFKQTNSSRWSHLLCAIWIPEVSLGNTTFMEPVMDVEKVPKPRWKLTCYICRQKMGACIQCGNKNCFVAFHVTCARRAKLFLQMKTSHGGSANLDASVLKAYCDKHVSSEWRRDHDVDAATADAIDYYRYAMRGRLWADSQQSAMSMIPAHSHEPTEVVTDENHPTPKVNLIVGGTKRKRNQSSKPIWRLPSGAPVIPASLYDSVESSLQRFTVRKRKDYAAEACKYWTLKREARRGAALLKRLQLQMETFSSMELTRRDFVSMGAAGGARLQRRIEFAENLLQDMEKLRTLCDMVKARELEKLRDAEMLRDIIDTVYFPIPPLLWPIMDKVQQLDSKGTFRVGLLKLRERLETRFYTSISTFSTDLGAVFTAGIGIPTVGDTTDLQSHTSGEVSRKDLSSEQKEKRKLARRIIKAVQGSLEDAVRKESELCRKPFEKELQDLDRLLETSISSRKGSMAESGSVVEDISDEDMDEQKLLLNGESSSSNPEGAFGALSGDTAVADGENTMDQTHMELDQTDKVPDFDLETGTTAATAAAQIEKEMQKASSQKDVAQHQLTPEDTNSIPSTNGTTAQNHKPIANSHHDNPVIKAPEPPTPPLSSGGDLRTPLSTGGVPWYMNTFDPVGTTIEEERWTGKELMREASEELSDMDEEELSGLVDEDGMLDSAVEPGEGEGAGTGHAALLAPAAAGAMAVSGGRQKAAKQKKRWRGFK